MSKTIGSAPTLEMLLDGAKKYFCGEPIRFEQVLENIWDVHNSKGKIEGIMVYKLKGRYRMTRIDVG